MNALLESGASVCEETPVSTIHLLSSFIYFFINLQIIVNFRCSCRLTTFFVHVIVYSHLRYSYSHDFFNLFSFKFFSFFFIYLLINMLIYFSEKYGRKNIVRKKLNCFKGPACSRVFIFVL